MGKNFGLRSRCNSRPARSRSAGRCSRSTTSSAASSCRRTARPTRSTRRRRSPRAPGSAARGSSRTRSVTRIRRRARPRRPASRPSDGDIAADTVVLCAGMWSHAISAAESASPCRCTPAEHFYIVTEPIAGPAAQPAGAARAGRMRLLQGGRRQAADRRLRAGGQALGHGRHPRGFLLRHAARGHRPLRADPRTPPSTACRCWRTPASSCSSTGRRASRRTTATTSARRRR